MSHCLLFQVMGYGISFLLHIPETRDMVSEVEKMTTFQIEKQTLMSSASAFLYYNKFSGDC